MVKWEKARDERSESGAEALFYEEGLKWREFYQGGLVSPSLY